VAPLLTGGGIIVKTLNGMAAARPTVATPLGNGGTGAQPGHDLLVAPAQPRPFAAAVVDVLTDQTLWQTLADNGRAFVRAHYDWPTNISRLEQFMAQLPRSSPRN
jgi:glycosyltransferase involved in cell wall biosynthesis